MIEGSRDPGQGTCTGKQNQAHVIRKHEGELVMSPYKDDHDTDGQKEAIRCIRWLLELDPMHCDL